MKLIVDNARKQFSALKNQWKVFITRTYRFTRMLDTVRSVIQFEEIWNNKYEFNLLVKH